MVERRAAFDKASADLRLASIAKDANEILEVKRDLYSSAKQEYFNTLDRLCFCILKGYVQDKDWRAEYREVLRQTIARHEKDFLAASPYRNIITLSDKWQRES